MKNCVNTVFICPEPSPGPVPINVLSMKELVSPKTPNSHPLAALGSQQASETYFQVQ